ncbi:MAG: Gx transporter family protein [Oscillospiraceae bacterium]|jgi:heptaprenyl diphosphate synthase|nr:Gx transporter family protein [Oscillospiraceae bacterium]
MKKARETAFTGLMLAIMLALTFVEHSLPPLPLLPPGIRLGLANIAPMYCVFFGGRTRAVALNALKAGFVLLTRGGAAGLLSFCGGMLSVGVVILLVAFFGEKASYTSVSVAGACAHNAGQFAAAWLLLRSPYFLAYLPMLLLSGILMGCATAALLRAALPALGRLDIWSTRPRNRRRE